MSSGRAVPYKLLDTITYMPNLMEIRRPELDDEQTITANLLTLNTSKTEFLLIGLQKQLTKIHNFSLNTTDSARNLGFIFDSHLTFSDQISSLSGAGLLLSCKAGSRYC